MGAAAFAAVDERQVAIAGLAGISLEEYASCLWAQLATSSGVALSVQLAHRSSVRGLLLDLADASQARFGDLVAETKQACAKLDVVDAAAATGGVLFKQKQ